MRKEKGRSFRLGLVAGMCALLLFFLSVWIVSLEQQMKETDAQICAMEIEEQVSSTSDWEATQSGSMQENISGPLKMALAGMKILEIFVWLCGMATMAAIVYVTLLKRNSEFRMYRILGWMPGKITGLLLVESCMVDVTGSICGGVIGILVLWLTKGRFSVFVQQPEVQISALQLLAVWIGAVAAAALTGILSGVLFTYRAAKKDII